MADYDPSGKTRIYWCEGVSAIGDIDAPELAEILAGVRVDHLAMRDGISGFSTEPTYTDSTPLSATYQEQVPSISNSTAGSLMLKRGNVHNDQFSTALNALRDDQGATGYVVFVLDAPGDAAPEEGDLVDVWPCIIGPIQPQAPVGGQMARYGVPFSINGQPAINVQIAAAS